MDSSFLFMMCTAAIGFSMLLGTLIFMLYRKFGFFQNDKTMESSSLSLALPPLSSLSRNWVHHVFPSFHGADVRKSFLSHVMKEFRSKGIDPFIDNEIRRGESIGPELKKAIQGSRIATVLLSKNYGSSSWCLDELVEIMKCKEDLGQTVMAIFYEVDPTDVRKQTGNFGKVFRKTCKGRTNEVVGRWRQALAQVATIAGYHSTNWDNEADMIGKIANDVSNMLISSTPSRDFDSLIGMRAHMVNIDRFFASRPDLDEVRMIGIWGPAGIGKTTVARCLFNRHSKDFQLSVFMANVRAMYTIPIYSDDYDVKLHLQQKFLSQIIDQKDIKIPHLGAAQERLKDKKVLVVLDDVDRLVQLEAMAKETWWFGQGSRIIITTQDLKLLKAHGINDIYKVDFPPSAEALQIFCMYAFGQKSPANGYEKLATEVTKLSGKLPLGLRVMGSYFRGMSKHDWSKALPRLMNHIDGEIESILKFSYDALCDEDKSLFLHIACFFNYNSIETLEDFLGKTFSDVKQGLNVLAAKSLICMHNPTCVKMHFLLAQLGKEIVRKEYVCEPGKRRFLVDPKDVCEVLSNDTAGSSSVIGIFLSISETDYELYTSERAFERMTNLQFLSIYGGCERMYFPPTINYLSRKLRSLEWQHYPLTCFPNNFNTKDLVKLYMPHSKLEKLWEGIQPLRNLKRMDLTASSNLKELPDLSTATNLEILLLDKCSSLVKLPSSIGNATNLKTLHLDGCSSLVELPSSIGSASNLIYLHLCDCSSLVELPSSIGNATNLFELLLTNCTSLVELPFSVGNLRNLWTLNLEGCTNLKALPVKFIMKSLNSLDILSCSFLKEEVHLNFRNCFKLNKESRNLIIQASLPRRGIVILPGQQVPMYFSDRATGDSIRLKLKPWPLYALLKFKVCIVLVDKVDDEAGGVHKLDHISYRITDKQNSLEFAYVPGSSRLLCAMKGHLYIFGLEAYVTSDEIFLELIVGNDKWTIKECGVRQLSSLFMSVEHQIT